MSVEVLVMRQDTPSGHSNPSHSGDANPYESPSDSSKGRHDWTLLKRFLLALSALLIVLAAISFASCWKTYNIRRASSRFESTEQTIDYVLKFFFDWNRKPKPGGYAPLVQPQTQ